MSMRVASTRRSSLTPAASPQTYSGAIPAALPRWMTAMARVQSGKGRARICVIGDSTKAGVGAGSSDSNYNTTNARPFSSTTQLGAILSASGLPTTNSNFVGDQNLLAANGQTYNVYETRFALNGATSLHTFGPVIGNAYFTTAISGNGVNFTVSGYSDTVEVYGLFSPGSGTINVKVNGGSTVYGSLNQNQSAGFGRSVVTIPRAQGNIINLAAASNNAIYICGLVAYDSQTPAIDIIQMGWSGSTTNSFLDNTHLWGPVHEYTLYSPDLWIIDLGINETTEPVATYQSNLASLIELLNPIGDVVMEVPNVINGGFPQAMQNAIYTVARELNAPVIDLQSRMISYASANSRGEMYDNLHPNAIGYADVARAEYLVLSQV